MAIRVKHPKDHPDVQASKEDDYKGKYYKDKKKSARRFADTVQTMMARKRSATEGSFRKGGRAGYDTGSRVQNIDTSGKPRRPQQPDTTTPQWITKKEKPNWITKKGTWDKTKEGMGKALRRPKSKSWITKKEKPEAWITKKEKPKAWITKKKKNKAMEKFQLGKGYNIGGRANLLEEMGRLDAERMNPNRRAEKHRVIGELNKGYKHGKRVKKHHGGSAQAHYVQHGYGPHKSSGKVLKGKKVGIQIK